MDRRTLLLTTVFLLASANLSGADDIENRVEVVNATIAQSPILTALSQTNDRRISIKKIDVLTFKAGRVATRMRTTPPNQLNCISGCYGELPSSVQCKNEGWDGVSVNWRCTANLQRGRKLESTRVRCEAMPENDPEYILAGSCALEYSLGGKSSGGGSHGGSRNVFPTGNGDHRKNPLQYIVPLIMIAIVVVILCAVFKACSRNRESSGVVIGPPPGQPVNGGGFYGGGQPAYPAQPGFNPGYAQPGYGAPVVAPQPNRSGNALGAGLGGFAAGAATGGLLGYMMGNRGSSDHHHHYSDGGSYGAYGSAGGGGGEDYGGGYEMSTDFADTAME